MRVLVAGDNRLERTILRTTVVRLGHSCAEAADGDAAWGAFCDFMPDVIISNWVLIGMTGPEFCRRVRATPQGRQLYFMLQTVQTQRGHVVEAVQSGVDAYLAKPVSVEDLTARLASAEYELAARQARSNDKPPLRGDKRLPVNPVIDMDQLADYRDTAGGQSELLHELVQIFRDDTATYLQELRGAIAHDNAKEVRRTAHSIKGSTTAIGARRMYAICVELEGAASAGNLPKARTLIGELQTAFEAAVVTLESITAA